ncbi:unnamed protein product, partial [Mesorhabditis spiculigera]
MAPQIEDLTGRDMAAKSPEDFDHIRFRVGNAKQAAFWFCASFGFQPFAYKGLETGCKELTAHAIKTGKIILVFEGTTGPDNKNFGDYLTKHGDSVQDVAFQVDDLEVFLEHARAKKTKIVREMTVESDEYGVVKYASILAFGDVIHTLIERKNYRGLFLPGFRAHHWDGQCFDHLPKTDLKTIDHFVGAQPEDEMESVVDCGVELLDVPDKYYDVIREKLSKSNCPIDADLDKLQELNIFIDFDEKGYILQKFTKPLDDRPTLFFEVIERHNFKGFGAGNFFAIFEAIERQQMERNTFYGESN